MSSQVQPSSATGVAEPSPADATYRKIKWRILPLIMLCYTVALIDRNVIGFARLDFMHQLGFNEVMYGIGTGMFFIGYFVFEVPSNLWLQKIGVRLTFLRIMILWGLACAAFAMMTSPTEFYLYRFLLGAAEAGFFPGVLLYITFWIPKARRASVTALFMAALPIAGMLGGPLAGTIMRLFDGALGLHGWQWLFIVEGLPACVLGVVVYYFLDNKPADAKWLTAPEKALVQADVDRDSAASPGQHHSLWQAFGDRRVYILSFVALAVFSGAAANAYWIPTIIKNSGIKDVLHVGLLSSIPFLAGLVTQFLVARHSDKVGERRWHVALCLGTAAAAWLVLGTTHLTTAPAIALLTVCTAATLGATGPFWTLPGSTFSGPKAAGSIALVTTLAGLGNVFVPMIVGVLIDKTGTLAASQLAYGTLLLAGAITIVAATRAPARP
jgi:MFS family permease